MKLNKNFILTTALTVILFSLSGQEMLVPLTSNPFKATRHEHPVKPPDTGNLRKKQAVSLQLPFKDDFYYASVSPYPSMQLWADSGAYINAGFGINPISIGVATFDGLNKHGYPYDPANLNLTTSGPADTLTSLPINLQVAGTQTLLPGDSLGLIFFYQARGYGENPEVIDSLMVDFYDPTNQVWDKRVWAHRGNTSTNNVDTSFTRAFIRIADPKYFHPDFRFRFRNKATTSGDFDHWHVDYVYLNKNLGPKDSLFNDVTFAYVPTPLLYDYSAMPYNQYRESEMATNMFTWIRNNSNITASMRYDHQVFQNGTLLHSYAGGQENLLPYHTGGYDKATSHTNFKPTYTLSVPPTDSTDFVAKHYITRDATGTNEFIRENDTVYQFQRFRNYFAYDDGGAEAGYYVNEGGARIAVKFRLNEQDTLRGVRIYFDPVGKIGQTSNFGFRILVWQAGSDAPAAVQHSFETVYKQQYIAEGMREIPEYKLETPVVLPAGNYFIGVQQQADPLVIGFDRNYDSHLKIWYGSNNNWTQSGTVGSLMLRPVMGRYVPPPVGIHEVGTEKLLLYPNPASDVLYISGSGTCEYTICDMTGRAVAQGMTLAEKPVDTSHLQAGIYVVTLWQKDHKPQTHKLVISR